MPDYGWGCNPTHKAQNKEICCSAAPSLTKYNGKQNLYMEMTGRHCQDQKAKTKHSYLSFQHFQDQETVKDLLLKISLH